MVENYRKQKNFIAEEELLASKKRGKALVMIGSKTLHVVFQISEYKFEYMGKVGER